MISTHASAAAEWGAGTSHMGHRNTCNHRLRMRKSNAAAMDE